MTFFPYKPQQRNEYYIQFCTKISQHKHTEMVKICSVKPFYFTEVLRLWKGGRGGKEGGRKGRTEGGREGRREERREERREGGRKPIFQESLLST